MAKKERELKVVCRYAEKGESAQSIIQKSLRAAIRQAAQKSPGGPEARPWR